MLLASSDSDKRMLMGQKVWTKIRLYSCSFANSVWGWLYMLWFNFILDLNYVFLCFKLIIIHNHTHWTNKNKIEPWKYICLLCQKVLLFFPDPLFSLQCSIMNMCSLKILVQLIRRSKPNRSTRTVYMNHPLACKGNLIWDNSVLLKRQTRCTNRQLTGELPD